MHGGGKVISAQAAPLWLLLPAQAIVIGAGLKDGRGNPGRDRRKMLGFGSMGL